ncbi:MDR family MFS transporter [Luteimicrobium subarcticum]|uniref:EmrB/QacA subfamily drug resistance transporter n=1 Tax=Luteimicrobium subarcticum TaxID=620910 RepID=A0A2M8W6T1_9MICO|nr:MDR family MFS transporter [Luteimicrobium subarcticum]PJI86619.1 EmrB/QacA subfamily drug resistance transporter [Luteimicrobium subarcticum]
MSDTPVSTPAGNTVAPTVHPAADAPMSHRQIMEALSGLLLGLFVAILSSTVVSNALPTIISSLHASETAYTWVITATLLAMTVSTPIWGKLSDVMSKKLLVQLGLIVYVLGSCLAGISQNAGTLITARAIQGIGAGGLTALVQTIIATMIPPRERGRYAGYMGGVFALGTIAGPLIGGAIVDTSWLGWRWCFYVGIPFALIALVVLQKTLHLPTVKRAVKIDWAGATLVAASVSLLLVWVSFAGNKYDWISWQTAAMVGGSIVLGVAFVLVERRAAEPIVPLHLFANRNITLAVVASLLVGIGMYSGTTFLSQFFQLARGDSPTAAGLLTLPMIIGLAAISLVSGRYITRTGTWKPVLVLGGVVTVVGLVLMGTARAGTSYGLLALYMFLIGAGLGMTMQNLVLSVQNQVERSELGSASAFVAFTRTLGGAVGVSALGALLATKVVDYVTDGLAQAGIPAGAMSGDSVPKVSTLPEPVRGIVESAYGHGVADTFLWAAPFMFLALVAIVFIKAVPLRTSNDEAVVSPVEELAADAGVALIEEDLAGVAADEPVAAGAPGRHVKG